MALVHNGYRASGALSPPVGTRLVIVSNGLEQGYLRARLLEEIGYRVGVCGEPGDARGICEEFSPGALVVDLGQALESLPDFVRLMRMLTSGPLVVVGGSGDFHENVTCLEAGADEVCRPGIPTHELDLRLRALLRLYHREPAEAPRLVPGALRIGELEIDPERKLVRKSGKSVALSPTEFRLLVTLAENAGRVVPSKALIARVWGEQYANETHYLRLYVRYLRQKLEDDPSEPQYIVNRWGAGYALEEPVRAA